MKFEKLFDITVDLVGSYDMGMLPDRPPNVC